MHLLGVRRPFPELAGVLKVIVGCWLKTFLGSLRWGFQQPKEVRVEFGADVDRFTVAELVAQNHAMGPVVAPEPESETIGLPGIVIPYPLSQLILEGKLRIHITPAKMPHGYCFLQKLGWLWLIESHSKRQHTSAEELFDEMQIVPPDMLDKLLQRPLESQIIGVVTFGKSVWYNRKLDFDAAFCDHFIPASHGYAWDAQTFSRVGWRIESVCRLSTVAGCRGTV